MHGAESLKRFKKFKTMSCRTAMTSVLDYCDVSAFSYICLVFCNFIYKAAK